MQIVCSWARQNRAQFIASLMSPDVPNFANRGCFVSSFTHSVKLCSFTSCSFNLQFLKPLLRSRLQFIASLMRRKFQKKRVYLFEVGVW